MTINYTFFQQDSDGTRSTTNFFFSFLHMSGAVHMFGGFFFFGF